jgi:hypothetical protein
VDLIIHQQGPCGKAVNYAEPGLSQNNQNDTCSPLPRRWASVVATYTRLWLDSFGG